MYVYDKDVWIAAVVGIVRNLTAERHGEYIAFISNKYSRNIKIVVGMEKDTTECRRGKLVQNHQ
jgi:hypothetical protein